MLDRTEIVHLFISIITISIAFTLPFFADFPTILLTVGLGFTLHELMHKYVAMKFGCVARYRAWMEGLVLAIFLALITNGRFVFAAPGAVYIYKQYLTVREDGIISLAGPLTNIVLGLVFLWIAFIPSLAYVGLLGFKINIFIAMFNLIPFGPLDGSKVFKWNLLVWAFVFGICILLFFFPQAFLEVVF